MSAMEIGFDREDVKPQFFKSHKFKAGKTVRCGVVFRDEQKPFKATKVHFNQRYYVCKSTKEKPAICCTHTYKGNDPRWRLGAVLVIYEISKKDGKDKLTGYELVPWVFSDKMYQKLNTANKEFPLKEHDILVSCDNEEFQNLIIQSCNACFWRSKPELEKKIMEESDPLFEKVGSNLASDLSIEEIKELLGIDTAGSDDAATDVQLDDVLDV